jgi:hypothetical protein
MGSGGSLFVGHDGRESLVEEILENQRRRPRIDDAACPKLASP